MREWGFPSVISMAEARAAELAEQALATLAAKRDPSVAAEAVESLIARLEGGLPPTEVAEVVRSALKLCRALYDQASSAATVALGQAALRAARNSGDPTLHRFAATTCGVITADVGDVVGAMELFIEALRLATLEDNHERMSGLWSNIGNVSLNSGNYEFAKRCYQRALTLVRTIDGPVYQRFNAHSCLSCTHQRMGDLEEGLRHAECALLELTPEIAAENPYGVVLLRRNFVRLLVDSGRLEDARVQVHLLAKDAESCGVRARIAYETSRAIYEVAIGQADIALTRLDKAIAESRPAPGSLHDALVCAVRCEETAGNAARALLRLEELSELVYRSNVDKAREIIRRAGMQEVDDHTEVDRENARARLISRLDPPRQPEGWKALQRLGASAVLPMDDTGWHGIRVGALSRMLAEAAGVPSLQAREIGLAAEVHDIGLTAIPREILAKRGPLNGSEREVVRRHAAAGAEMLAEGRHPRMLLAQEIARYHHARYDGEGYPARVGGDFIPLPARICAVADAYDSMVCGNGHQPHRSMEDALQELRRNAGTQFDPELVECFDDVIRSEAGGRGLDLSSDTGMEDFQDLVLSLKEDRGFA